MKTYVLTVSKTFPKNHKKSGQSTGFVENISSLFTDKNTKIHTIRANYDFWLKRVREINKGNAVLSIRYWSGKPYNSKQIEICKLERVGIQQLDQSRFTFGLVDNNSVVNYGVIAENDGLSFEDFEEWFKNYDKNKQLAIIHFTNFKY